MENSDFQWKAYSGPQLDEAIKNNIKSKPRAYLKL